MRKLDAQHISKSNAHETFPLWDCSHALPPTIAMDPLVRSQYPEILDGDWVNLGYHTKPVAGLYDLEAQPKKHLLFNYSAWSDPLGSVRDNQRVNTVFTEDDYTRLCSYAEPVFQLASRMLESPGSLDLFYYILYGKRDPLPAQYNHKGEPCSELRLKDMGKGHRREQARDALERLADSLAFEIDDPRDDERIRGTHAWTAATTAQLRTRQGVNVKRNNSNAKNGIASIIHINKADLRRLEGFRARCDQATRREADSLRLVLFRLQFKIANTLCHEITHALEHARNDTLFTYRINEQLARYDLTRNSIGTVTQVNEPYFGKQSLAELGACWENHVFGGKIQLGAEPEYPLIITKWPSFIADTDVPHRRGFKGTATNYIVPMHYICNLHTQAFWDKTTWTQIGDHTALHIRKLIGWRVPKPAALKLDETWDPYESEEGTNRTTAHNNNRVSREIKDEPDPSCCQANDKTALPG